MSDQKPNLSNLDPLLQAAFRTVENAIKQHGRLLYELLERVSGLERREENNLREDVAGVAERWFEIHEATDSNAAELVDLIYGALGTAEDREEAQRSPTEGE